jgi:hypothetical protein
LQAAKDQERSAVWSEVEVPATTIPEGGQIPETKHDPPLDPRKLDDQESLFICTMESNVRKVMEGDVKTVNPLTKLWRIVDTSSMLRHGLSEYLKLAEIATVLVLGSIKDERTFSTLSFMKDKLRNRLQTHLPLVVSMHRQNFYDITTFSYEQAYHEWKKSIRLIDDI